MKIRPLGENIILKRTEPDEKIGILFIPESARALTNLAEVVAVGPGRFNDETGERETIPLKPGEVVIVSRWSGSEVEFEGVNYLFCRPDVIHGVIEGDLGSASIRPLGENVVLTRINPKEKIGSLYVPESARKDTNLARIVSVGEDASGDLKPGQKVMIHDLAGSEVELDGVKYLFFRPDVIHGVFEDAGEAEAQAA